MEAQRQKGMRTLETISVVDEDSFLFPGGLDNAVGQHCCHCREVTRANTISKCTSSKYLIPSQNNPLLSRPDIPRLFRDTVGRKVLNVYFGS